MTWRLRREADCREDERHSAGLTPPISSLSAVVNNRNDTSIARTTLSPMAMGKRRRHAKQPSMWVVTQDLPRSAAHPFYARLNQILNRHDFDGFVEGFASGFMRTRADRACRRDATSASSQRSSIPSLISSRIWLSDCAARSRPRSSSVIAKWTPRHDIPPR
jgi:hypothetical protein